MSGQVLTPAGVLELGDERPEISYGPASPATVLGAYTVLVSPLLPVEPSPAEIARRIVRHGYHDAGLLPDVEGEVGPRPGDKIRAIEAHGRLFVDAELARELAAEAARARDRAWAGSRRIARERVDLGVIAQMLGVPWVEALREPDYFRTLYRAHLEPEGAVWTGGPQVRISDAELAGVVVRDPWRRRAYIAGKLRKAVVEWKLDEEEAGRTR